jgi:hypothetical protein
MQDWIRARGRYAAKGDANSRMILRNTLMRSIVTGLVARNSRQDRKFLRSLLRTS